MAALTELLIPITAALIAMIGSVVSGIILWLVKDKFSSLETEIERNRREREREHEVTLKWLAKITNGINSDKDKIETPEEVTYAIDKNWEER
mgnify:CR=1 FL=1